MPIATPEVYADMISRAKEGGFAYPAINCTSSETVNAALRGFADAGSDGIIQFSTGGAEFASGTKVKDMVTGAVALAEFAHVVAAKYPVQRRAAHRPLPEGQARRLRPPADRAVAGAGRRRPGAAVPVAHVGRLGDRARREPGDRRRSCIEKCAAAKIVLELEIGVVGGEEDGVANEINEKLYTDRGDFVATAEGARAWARRASTCWRRRSATCTASTSRATSSSGRRSSSRVRTSSPRSSACREDKPFNLVFHGGSGSAQSEIREALSYGVVKMNVDTDTQYAFTRPIVGHMFSNYDGVLKVDGEVGNKKAYDPRSYLKAAEIGMADRVVQACEDLLSAGTSRSA